MNEPQEHSYTVSAPIVAIASTEVLATSEEEAIDKGYKALMGGDENRGVHVSHDFDIDHEEVRAERSDVDPARAVAVHVATQHFHLREGTVADKISATYEQWQAMHEGLHQSTACTHTHPETA